MKLRALRKRLIAKRTNPGPSPLRVRSRGHVTVNGHLMGWCRTGRYFYTPWRRPGLTISVTLNDVDPDNLRIALGAKA